MAPKKTPTPVKATPTPAAVDRDATDATLSHPSSPDLVASMVMSEADLTAAENLYRDNLNVKVTEQICL